MAKKLDQIIVIDLEATCWEGDPPPGQKSEIIEIGVCLLDVNTCQRIGRESILVRPVHSQVSPFCTQLTTLTQEQVDAGIPFAEAVQHLRREYRPQDRTWASYGDYDRIMFDRQCRDLSLPYPFGRSHINIKNLLALLLNMPNEIGLDTAMSRLGMPMEGTHHRGGDDAWNIAAVLAYLLTHMRQNSRMDV